MKLSVQAEVFKDRYYPNVSDSYFAWLHPGTVAANMERKYLNAGVHFNRDHAVKCLEELSRYAVEQCHLKYTVHWPTGYSYTEYATLARVIEHAVSNQHFQGADFRVCNELETCVHEGRAE